MIHAVALCLTFVITLSESPNSGYREPTPDEGKILAEYVEAAQRLDRRFQVVSGSGTFVSHEIGEKPLVLRRIEFSRRSKFHMIMLSKWFEPENMTPMNEERVIGSNPNYAFFLGRNPEGSEIEYHVKSLGADDGGLASASFQRFCFDYVDAVRGTFCGNSSDVFSRPGLMVRSIDRIDCEGRPCLKIEYRHAPSDDTRVYPTGWIIVSPQEGWVTKEYFCRHAAETGVPIRGRVLYEAASDDDIPTPSEAIVTYGDQQKHFRFESIRFEPYPESRFHLSSYGLPEDLASPRHPRSSSSLAWLALGSGGLLSTLALSVFLRSSRGRRNG